MAKAQHKLDIFVGEQRAGFLGRSELQARRYVYGYFPDSGDEDAVSLTMPVMADQYVFQQGVHRVSAGCASDFSDESAGR